MRGGAESVRGLAGTLPQRRPGPVLAGLLLLSLIHKETVTEQALSRPTEEFVRSHGLRLVVSAVAELESGNLDAACAAGTRAVEVAGRISSARTTEYVRDLLHRLEPYGDEPRVVELRERARPLLAAPA